MPTTFSKPIVANLAAFVLKGKKRRVVSLSIVAIVLLLIKLRLTKGSTDNIKLQAKKTKRGKGNVDLVFFQRIAKLIKIVIPSLFSPEVADLVLLT